MAGPEARSDAHTSAASGGLLAGAGCMGNCACRGVVLDFRGANEFCSVLP